MSDFDRFDLESDQDREHDASVHADGNAVTEGAADRTEEQSTPQTQWYSISYQNNNQPPVVVPMVGAGHAQLRKKRGSKLALVSLIVAVCVLFCAVAGLGGYLIADLVNDRLDVDDLNGNAPVTPSGSSGGGTSDTVFEVGDAENYDYASVVINKNDGTGLAGSPNGSAGDNATTRIAAVAAVRNSVVEISTTTISNRGQLSAGAGSGVIIHADGIIVTNNHVIDGVNNIYVRLTNGNTYEAYLRGTDEENDIAILKITPRETLTVAKLGCSAALAWGEDVFAIGNPLGELGGTVTEGIISALEREVEMSDGTVMTLLQTSAAINSGNSGGGLFNMAGELIGVVNAKYSASGVEGLGFAIPVDTAILSINDLLDHGYIPGVPAIGATIVDNSMQVGYWQFVNMPYVYAVDNGSPLKVGDFIYQVDGTVVSTVSALKRLIRTKNVGDTVTLTIYRNNQQQTVEVTLIEYIPQNSTVNFN
ncbi:MAG: trypsin-like peptidase domain-containing protein [Clostridia bacterium]|nr:trypsin-like peptidase domain-containing protein [Clostridia bacterium]MBQ3056874.1 trypsin-like peptidase domain-containing protein [Clostridia bacterium]